MPIEDIAKKLGMDEQVCRNYFHRACHRILTNAQARALNLNVPEPQAITLEALSDKLSRLPEHQRKIGRLACMQRLWARPEEIARITGYKLQLVQTNLEQIWGYLSSRFYRDFPDALQLLYAPKKGNDAPGTTLSPEVK
jgi:DNA-directed RNA polymerase specialized sigma24 family protein